MSLPQNHRYQSSRSLWLTFSFGMLGNDKMAIRRFVRKTKCMCSSCLLVVGSFRVSSSSSFSHPSTVTFFEVLMGRSSWSGRAEMMYLLAIHPTSPWAQSLNCFFRRASEPWSSNRGMGNWTIVVQVWSSCRRSQRASSSGADCVVVCSNPAGPTRPGCRAPVPISCCACLTHCEMRMARWLAFSCVMRAPPRSVWRKWRSAGELFLASVMVGHRSARSSTER